MNLNSYECDNQISLFNTSDLTSGVGKMSAEHCHQEIPKEKILGASLKKSQGSSTPKFMYLRLKTESGQMPDVWTVTDGASHGVLETQLTKECHRDVEESFLWQILQETVPQKYYLSERACLGILRRSEKRGKTLPEVLRNALLAQANISEAELQELLTDKIEEWTKEVNATAKHQQDLIQSDLGVARTLAPGTHAAGSHLTKTLITGLGQGHICLNDQGGQQMGISEGIAATLRSQEHGHQPIVLEGKESGAIQKNR